LLHGNLVPVSEILTASTETSASVTNKQTYIHTKLLPHCSLSQAFPYKNFTKKRNHTFVSNAAYKQTEAMDKSAF